MNHDWGQSLGQPTKGQATWCCWQFGGPWHWWWVRFENGNHSPRRMWLVLSIAWKYWAQSSEIWVWEQKTHFAGRPTDPPRTLGASLLLCILQCFSACRTSRASARRIVSCRGACASSLCPQIPHAPAPTFGAFRLKAFYQHTRVKTLSTNA